jgi:hypothetical protein
MYMNVNVNMNIDVRKWGWPGYLTFGKSSGKKQPGTIEPKSDEKRENVRNQRGKVDEKPADVDVDKDALEDAMSSDNMSVVGENETHSGTPRPATVTPEGMIPQSPSNLQETETVLHPVSQDASPGCSHTSVSGDLPPVIKTQLLESSTAYSNNSPETQYPPDALCPLSVSPAPSHQTPTITDIRLAAVALPKLLSMNVYLAESDDALITRRQKIYYIMVSSFCGFRPICIFETALETSVGSRNSRNGR